VGFGAGPSLAVGVGGFSFVDGREVVFESAVLDGGEGSGPVGVLRVVSGWRQRSVGEDEGGAKFIKRQGAGLRVIGGVGVGFGDPVAAELVAASMMGCLEFCE
jgi:hypothetical protein